MDVIARYLARYEVELDRPLEDADPLFCITRHSRWHPTELSWGDALASSTGLRHLLARRASQAGLDHLAPHDLKRTAARMMFEARSADGGHVFDLAEIADVLDHSNAKVTKDCYIGPLGTGSKHRAAELFG
jgi:integrase